VEDFWMPDLLTAEDIERSLENLEGWELEGKAIAREFEFETFLSGIAFVVTVATAAEELNHHPDIDIRYRRVRVAVWTHSAGGLTELDLSLAGRCNELAEEN
jgi:4a-hydroxytetrahydrobiopterin dehydratase